MTRVAQAAGMDTALHALDVILASGGGDGMCPIRHQHGPGYDGDKREITWHRPMAVPGRLSRFVRMCDEQWSDEMEVALPCKPYDTTDIVDRIPILWCRVEGKDQLKHAFAFRPLPSLVLTEGSSSRKLLVWWLTKPLDYYSASDFNRKLAYRMRATQKHGLPEHFRLALPGTCLRDGRTRPSPVVVSRLKPDRFDGAAMVARLRQPPEVEPGAWRRASGK